jgi:hypothetical protein
MWKHEILGQYYFNDIKDVKEHEKILIQLHNTLIPNGYNMTEGGNGGKEHTKTYKQEMSDRFMGEKNPFFNRKHTDVSRQKISDNVPKCITSKYDITGKLIKTYISMLEASTQENIPYTKIVGSCKSKKIFLLNGFIWKKGDAQQIFFDNIVDIKQLKTIISSYNPLSGLLEKT